MHQPQLIGAHTVHADKTILKAGSKKEPETLITKM